MECLMFFSPGELIGLLRAERAGRALDESLCYRAILLGITRASLNTQSFISEASFQETARKVPSEQLFYFKVPRLFVNNKKKKKQKGSVGKMTRKIWNINLEEMMEAGVHFGHGTKKWILEWPLTSLQSVKYSYYKSR
uniref:Uncharacterized protein n=1 Tax=Ananas comosus var. bracteatus TaxID=296719 RepID=A0A6V7PVK8_ANACO|nr:unnamed protein product [Ananas comosus var. bracteatus]